MSLSHSNTCREKTDKMWEWRHSLSPDESSYVFCKIQVQLWTNARWEDHFLAKSIASQYTYIVNDLE